MSSSTLIATFVILGRAAMGNGARLEKHFAVRLMFPKAKLHISMPGATSQRIGFPVLASNPNVHLDALHARS